MPLHPVPHSAASTAHRRAKFVAASLYAFNFHCQGASYNVPPSNSSAGQLHLRGGKKAQGNVWLSEGKGSLPMHVEFISLCDYYAESYEYITLRKTSDFIRIFFVPQLQGFITQGGTWILGGEGWAAAHSIMGKRERRKTLNLRRRTWDTLTIHPRYNLDKLETTTTLLALQICGSPRNMSLHYPTTGSKTIKTSQGSWS